MSDTRIVREDSPTRGLRASTDERRRRVCTIAAKNYLPSVAVFAASFARHHPTIPVSVLVVDASPDDFLDEYSFEVLRPDMLSLSDETFRQMATYYEVTELCTALKPYLLQEFVGRFGETAIYMDPDIEVFAPLDDLFEKANAHGLVLTPHVLKPVPRDNLDVQEEAFLLSGQFNLGFVAVTSAGQPFLSYWADRTRLFAIRDVARGYFVDQRWVDAAPALFDPAILRDPGCNVAYWNLHERDLRRDRSGQWTVDERPLRFFHFSGHSPREPYPLSVHLVREPRVRVDQQAPVRQLLQERSDRLRAAGWHETPPPYRWGRSVSGIDLSAAVRRLYWTACHEADLQQLPRPPHAFGPSGDTAFSNWLTAPASVDSPVPRYLMATWHARPDLQRSFPDPLGADGAPIVDWTRRDEPGYLAVPPPLRTRPPTAIDGMPGVNLVAYLSGEFGVAAAGRLVARMVRATGLPMATELLTEAIQRRKHLYPSTIQGAPFQLSLLAMNADALLHYGQTARFERHRRRPRVGIWYWEVSTFPEQFRAAFELVDEVWCTTDFVRDALIDHASCPVRKHPLVIDIPTSDPHLVRSDLGLPDEPFLFGFAFDYASVARRKNPIGLIEAYRRAFGPADGAALVVKSICAAHFPHVAAAVREAADGREDIVLIDEYLDPVEMRAFFALIDCYVSLHRSEGLGLTIAAAMAAGTPAVATGWSGNLEFMTPENSFLIPYELEEVGERAHPYPATACWARPDLDAAADTMRGIFDDPSPGQDRARRARRDLRAYCAAGPAASWFEPHFETLVGSGAA